MESSRTIKIKAMAESRRLGDEFLELVDSGRLGERLQLLEYRLESVLGAGGFGITYLAHQRSLDRQLVVKVPNVYLRHDPDYDKYLDRFIKEGRSGTYDFAFIDADKTGYDAYYERCLALVRTGGLIALDNMLWGGAVAHPARDDDADTAALQALNAKLGRDPRIDHALLTVGDGVALARKR